MNASFTPSNPPDSNDNNSEYNNEPTYGQPETNIYNPGVDKNLATYNQFLDEIERVSKITVQQTLNAYAKIEYVNKTNLRLIIQHYKIYESFKNDNWFLENLSNKDLSAFLDTAYEYNFISNDTRIIILEDRNKFFEFISESQLEQLIEIQNELKVIYQIEMI